jgi:hypothetical protein
MYRQIAVAFTLLVAARARAEEGLRNVSASVAYERPLENEDRGYFSRGKDVPQGLFGNTPYVLNHGEWQLGIGPAAVGIADRLQLETNLWLLMFKAPTLGAKVALLRETRGDPFSLSVNATGTYVDRGVGAQDSIDVGGAIAKTLRQPDSAVTSRGRLDVYAGGAYARTRTEDESVNFALTSPLGTRLNLGIAWYFSDWVKLDAEGIACLSPVWSEAEVEPVVAASLHMAWEYFNLRLGAWTLPNMTDELPVAFLPYVSLYWRFGGALPSGN